jgi:internalin A
MTALEGVAGLGCVPFDIGHSNLTAVFRVSSLKRGWSFLLSFNRQPQKLSHAMRNPFANCFIVCAVLALPLLSARAAEETSPAVVFKDKNLEKAVRKFVIEKRDSDKPLTEADLGNLSTIQGNGMDIADLSGLEKCVNLASLELAKNKISNLEPLKGLTKIQFLNLAGNKIEDIRPLSEIIALQYLELSGNHLKTVEPLKGLTNMASLYLSTNSISDITPVLGMKKLSSLYLDNNKIKSIPPGNQWRGLSSFSANNNSISDLSPITNLDHLFYLMAENNKIRDLGPWPDMSNPRSTNEFLPFLNLYLKGNSLNSASKKKLNKLKEIGTKVNY